jgi:hypothetical protein
MPQPLRYPVPHLPNIPSAYDDNVTFFKSVKPRNQNSYCHTLKSETKPVLQRCFSTVSEGGIVSSETVLFDYEASRHPVADTFRANCFALSLL